MAIIFLKFLLISAIFIHLSQAFECPSTNPGWMHSGDYCYLISPTRLSWYEAQEYCWSYGGFLAEIKSAEEQQHIDAILHKDIFYWIGASDLATEGSFVWAESHEAVDYANWRPGEPNNDDNEDCVEIGWNSDGVLGWNDEHCTSTEFHAFCQTDIVETD